METMHVFYEYEVAKLLSKWKLKRILFPCENQTWEKVYTILKKKQKNPKIIGYQHSGLSQKMLNYFPSKIDQSLPIFPDTILTVGQIFTKLLNEKAYFSSNIKTFFAYRFKKHQTNNNFQCNIPSSTINKAIIYAFSNNENGYKEKYLKVIQTLLEIFKILQLQFISDFIH